MTAFVLTEILRTDSISGIPSEMFSSTEDSARLLGTL